MTDDRATALLIERTLRADDPWPSGADWRTGCVRDEQEPIDYQFGTDQ